MADTAVNHRPPPNKWKSHVWENFCPPPFAPGSDSDFLVGFIFSSISPIFPVLNFTFHGGVVLCVFGALSFAISFRYARFGMDGLRRGEAGRSGGCDLESKIFCREQNLKLNRLKPTEPIERSAQNFCGKPAKQMALRARIVRVTIMNIGSCTRYSCAVHRNLISNHVTRSPLRMIG